LVCPEVGLEREKLTSARKNFNKSGQNSGMPGRLERLYLLPIGGTAMAPLAALLSEAGFAVTGSDTALYPPMSTLLERLRIPVRPGFRPDNLPHDVDRVIIGNAVSRTNPEVEEVLRRGLPYVSMAQAIHDHLLPGRHSVVVAGTHGKTTTAALLAWLLYDAGRDPGFLIGGELLNFGQGYRRGEGAPFVLEGDEYNAAFFDRGPKFLHYAPRTLLLNNIEFDHADLYADLPSLIEAFRKGIRLVPPEGSVIANADDERVISLLLEARAEVACFSLSAGKAVHRAAEVDASPAGTDFDYVERGTLAGRMHSPLYGRHNLTNALGAIAAARGLGLEPGEIASALARFRGVRRRLELRGEPGGVAIVDDFAHHPTAVAETLAAARQRWPARRLWAVFEPRTNTAGRKFFEMAYEAAFAAADAVVIAPIFHAGRFPPEELLDREALVAALRGAGHMAFAPASLSETEALLRAEARPGDVLLLMSSGAFGGLHEKLLQAP
jgi:UDP-N-acetylmuramate: L-alanyl-gamma-D-glutamyl-meso-diaminopimelate ligase